MIGETANSVLRTWHVYLAQLQEGNQVVQKRRLNQNGLCTINIVEFVVLNFTWEVFPHLPFALGLAVTDFRFSRLLGYRLRAVTFDTDRKVKM